MTAFSKKFYRSLIPLVKAVDIPRPADWAEIFGRQAPLELEIGFGNGEFMHRYSLENPGRNLVGVEVAWASIKRALRRLDTPPRQNVRLMMMRGEVALERCFAPQSLDVIRALFPVPWPDERREQKRLFQRSFLDLAATRLKDGGAFIIVTDSPDLAQWTLAQADGSALVFDFEERPAEMDTKYERKWQGGGRQIFYHLTGRKISTPQLAAPQEIEMQAFYCDSFNPDTYQPQNFVGDTIVKFKEFVYDRQKQQGLLRAMVMEGTLTQEFFIKISNIEGRWKVSPAIASQLFPTQGVAKALELAAAPTAP